MWAKGCEIMSSPIFQGVAVTVISAVILYVLKVNFERYRKTSDFTKGIFAYAACEIAGVASAVVGYALLAKSASLSAILFVFSAACVALTTYMFFAAATAVNKFAEATEQFSKNKSDGAAKNL